MPKAFSPHARKRFSMPRFLWSLKRIIQNMPPLVSRGNKPLEFTFEQQLTALILFHLEEHRTGQELLHFLDDDDPEAGIAVRPSRIAPAQRSKRA